MSKKVRLRFAPSPTGGLHLGGVRTVLYNYLYARQHGGQFILRIEDTDQSRFVPGAEEYIMESLRWCGLEPDESPDKPGKFGPYRQSVRRHLYLPHALRLIEQGHAYYAFDTPAELDSMREKFKTHDNPSPQYNHVLRKKMRNSLYLDPAETQALLDAGTPYVIRIRIDPGHEVRFTDMIRGEVSFQTDGVDDKVLMKADGMPTYHLAVVVDDHLMEISHAFRGEEWLPSAPVHILLWRYLFGEDKMPHWAHLPLILKPDGNGKLSKRDGDRLGFPVFSMNWTDPKTKEPATGFRETGFLPEAFVNLLAMLGWNDGSGQEIFTLEELIQRFSMDRVHKGGAKFDFEKAKWFNHEWIKTSSVKKYSAQVLALFREKGIPVSEADSSIPGSGHPGNTSSAGQLSTGAANTDPAPSTGEPSDAPPSTFADAFIELSDAPHFFAADMIDTPGTSSLPLDFDPPMVTPVLSPFEKVLDLVKDRCTLLPDFIQQASFFFIKPATIDLDAVKPKWTPAKNQFFVELLRQWEFATTWEAAALETGFKEMAAAAMIKPGELLMPLRVMLVGGKFGPHVFDIAALLGPAETRERIRYTLGLLEV